jgi:hypothetical protein
MPMQILLYIINLILLFFLSYTYTPNTYNAILYLIKLYLIHLLYLAKKNALKVIVLGKLLLF